MGEVYRALDTRLDRVAAIKVLASHLSSSPELKQRMEREARAISSLNHPNICHLYDIGSQDGADFLVMEYLEGETLAEKLRKSAPPLSEIYKIGIAVAEALAFAHRSGIVHRDLKPGNIMLTQGGEKVSTDSVVYAMIPPEGNPKCQASRGPFLEVHAGTPSHMSIRNRAVLKGEVTYFAEIGYMLPEPWAKRAIDSITNFVVMKTGTIYIELVGVGAILIVGVAMFVFFIRRKALLRSQN